MIAGTTIDDATRADTLMGWSGGNVVRLVAFLVMAGSVT